jgi:hypothetical protein
MTLTLIVLGLGALYVLPNRRTAFARSQASTVQLGLRQPS